MTQVSSWSPPFGLGPLNALHEALLLANGFDLWAAALWLLASSPLLLQAYLLLQPNTRRTRAAIGTIGFAMVANVWTRYRFVDPAFNAANCFLTAGAMFFLIRYVEWSLLKGPVVDPWMTRHGRHHLLAALDLTINIRGVFLGGVGLDTISGQPKRERDEEAEKRNGHGNARTEGERIKRVPSSHVAPPIERHLPHPRKRTAGRVSSIRRHLFNVVWRFILADIVSTHLRVLGGDTILAVGGRPGAIAAFVNQVHVRLLPRLLDVQLPSWAVAGAAQLAIPLMVCTWLSIVYHIVALLAISSTFWSPAAWDVDLFDSPFLATSVIELWGRRWHQVLRHSFVILAASTAHLLYLPQNSCTIIILAFFWSATFHALAHLAMDPVPESRKIMAFFLLSGLGCTAEVIFKRVTGRRVGGWAGRLWTAAFMLITGRLAVDAWCDAGFLTLFELPSDGIGDAVSAWLWAVAYTPFKDGLVLVST